MPIYLSWQQIAVRLLCTVIAGLLIGINRGERGRAAGMRTNVLVCLAAAIAMVEANVLMDTVGKTSSSFAVLDLARFPLGILSGMGFIGAGAVLRKGNRVTGLTSAATLWVVTTIGLCFGAGLLWLGAASTILVLLTLSGLKILEARVEPRRARLSIQWHQDRVDESQIRSALEHSGTRITTWSLCVEPEKRTRTVTCEVRWHAPRRSHYPPTVVDQLLILPGIVELQWKDS